MCYLVYNDDVMIVIFLFVINYEFFLEVFGMFW